MKKMVSKIVLAFGVVAFILTGAHAEEAKKKVGTNVGDYLAEFKLADIDGGTFESKSVVGKKKAAFVMVSPTCSLCRKEITELENFSEEIQGGGDLFIVVAASANAAKRFASSYEGKYRLLIDEEYVTLAAGNFRVTPSTLIVDQDGKIVERFSQYKDGQAEAVAKLMK